MIVILEKWLYLGKSGCVLEKVVVFRHILLLSGKIGIIRAKVLYLGENFVFGQNSL